MTQLLCIVFVLQKHEFVSRRGQLHNTTANSSSPGVIIRFYFFSSFFFFFCRGSRTVSFGGMSAFNPICPADGERVRVVCLADPYCLQSAARSCVDLIGCLLTGAGGSHEAVIRQIVLLVGLWQGAGGLFSWVLELLLLLLLLLC